MIHQNWTAAANEGREIEIEREGGRKTKDRQTEREGMTDRWKRRQTDRFG